MGSLRTVNLNLLPILRVLLREVSVVRAAAVLGLSPSATSEALGRLRDTLDDPLLMQVGRSMQLTPRALTLVHPVDELCDAASRLLRPMTFEAARSQRSFTLATADYGVVQFGGPVLRRLRTTAPGVQLRFVDVPNEVAERLGSGELDFAVLARFMLDDAAAAQSAVRLTTLGIDDMIGLFSTDHVLAQRSPLTPEDLCAHPVIGLSPTHGLLERRRLQALHSGLALHECATVPHVTLLPPLLACCVGWALVPRRLAEQVASPQSGLVMRELPLAVQASVELCLAWGRVNDSDPAHAWLKSVIADTAAPTPEPP